MELAAASQELGNNFTKPNLQTADKTIHSRSSDESVGGSNYSSTSLEPISFEIPYRLTSLPKSALLILQLLCASFRAYG
jgi:hypothetical protein